MGQILRELTNREISLLVWLLVLLAFVWAKRDLRQSFNQVLKAIFLTRIGVALLAMILYVALIVLGSYAVGLWHLWMLKDTLFWLFGSGVILLFNIDKAAKEERYFKSVTIENLKFATILTFILNLYVFNIWVELALAPILAVLAMLIVVAGTKAEYGPAEKLFKWVMGLVGAGLLVYVTASLLADFKGFATLKNLEDFLVPVALTLTLLPFIYILALYMSYELIFVRLGMFLRERQDLVRFAKWQAVRSCRLRLGSVRRFSGEYTNRLGRARDRAKMAAVVTEFRADP